jgi:colicin import membrane protein
MLRRVEFVANRVQDEGVPPDGPVAPPTRPAGALEALLDHGPAFRGSVRGYDRVQVDNYVAWAENELAAAQREREHLLDRVVACGTELEISRRLIAEQPVGRGPAVSARVGEVLRLAEDQAAQVLDAAEAEAAQLRADARLEADARLRKAHEIKELAIEVADQLRVSAQRNRAEGVAALEEAQAEAEELLRAAAAERDRLAAAAAAERDRLAAEAAAELERAAEQARRDRAAADDAAGAHLAALRTEVEDLWRQRDQARESLRCLTDRIGAALQAVGVPPAEELALLGGRAEPVTG